MRRLLVALALAAVVAPVTPAAADWPTYHGNNTRQGNDSADQGLNAPTALWTSASLDGALYGQPVVVGNQAIVATENNSVYSLNTATGAVQWGPVHLGAPRTSNFPCGNINPLGITSTPAIDAGNVFVVAEIQTSPTTFYWDLATLTLSTGAVTRQVNMNPSDPRFQANYQQQRSALMVSGGRVFFGLGGLAGDCGTYHGYVVSYPETGSGTERWWASTEVDPSDNEGAVWAPGGQSSDDSGNVFVSTGNSNHTSSGDAYDYSDSVVKLSSSTLGVLDYFAPDGRTDATHDGGNAWYDDNAGDVDLGSTAPLQLPNHRILIVGKSGMGYLLDSTNLGHIGGSLAAHQVCSATNDAVFGSLAYALVGGVETAYVGCSGSDGTKAVQIAGSGSNFSVSSAFNGAGRSDRPPTVAGNLVWAVGGTTLYGMNESTGALVHSFAVSGANHFTSPSASGNELLVEGGTAVNAFQGTQPAAVNGFTLDVYGNVYHFGSVASTLTPPAPTWPGFPIARGLVALAGHTGGYTLDGYGGVHPWGTAPVLGESGVTGQSPPWPNFDIARALVVSGSGGYILDGYGGVHSIGSAPAVAVREYWPNWDIARALVLRSDGHSGWVLDGYGGLHGFGTSGDVPQDITVSGAYWPGWNIARSVVLDSDSSGYTLDGFGGIHSFGGAPTISTAGISATTPPWPNWDIARSISLYQIGATPAGYLLDGYGGIHAIGAATANASPAYTPGQDTFRTVSVTS